MPRQANFAKIALTPVSVVGQAFAMGKVKHVTGTPMPFLRAWRESLKLSRQVVADRIGSITGPTPDQATVAKWESGSVRVEDLELLAQVYGTRPDRPVSYTHLTLPTKPMMCRSRWSPYH